MDKLQEVRQNEQLRTLLMTECDIYFYDNVSEVQFSGNNEEYSLACKAFAQDGSGGEYVFLEDNSIGFIGSEGQVGRVAESLDDLLTFLLHAGCISDFSCRYLYQNTDLLKAFCKGYVAKIRESYQTKQEDWDQVRGNMVQKLSLDFNPEKLEEVAMTFYQSATREPVFFCKYTDGEEEYACDSVLSDIVGLWTTELVGMSREESVLMISFQCESKLVSMLKDLSYDILGRNCQYGWTRNLHRKIGEVLFWIPYFTF